MRNFIDNKEYRAWNEGMSKRFDPELFYSCENKLVSGLEKKRLQQTMRLLSYSKDERLLDVGCGSGKLEEILGSGKIVGMDISDFLLAKARQRIPRIVKAQGEAMPFKKQSFDKIACTEVLEHVMYPGQLLKEMARVLKTDGTAVISIPNEGLINIAKKAYSVIFFWKKDKTGSYAIPKRMQDYWHIHSFSLKLLENISKDVFCIEKIKYLPSRFFALRYVVRCRLKESKVSG